MIFTPFQPDALFGRTAMNNMLAQISAMLTSGAAVVRLTTKTSAGVIAPGVPLAGAQTISGATPITDENGVAYLALPANTTATISVGDVIDLTGSVSIQAPPNAVTDRTLTVTYVNYKQITTSAAIRLSGACTRLDVCCVGGGGGGAASYSSTQNVWRGAGGGGGGTVVTKEMVAFRPNTSISVTIGAGGAKGITTNAGGNGGTSVLNSGVQTVSASGGGGGTISGGGTGNGNGGNARSSAGSGNAGGSGTQSGYGGFATTRLFGGGGGGGAYGTSATYSGGAGGSPYGGAGGEIKSSIAASPGSPGISFGGGGGGASAISQGSGTIGSAGYQGLVCLRMWHGEENA